METRYNTKNSLNYKKFYNKFSLFYFRKLTKNRQLYIVYTWPTAKKICYTPISYFLQTTISIRNEQLVYIPIAKRQFVYIRKKNYNSLYSLLKSGICEYHISSTLCIIKYLLAYLFHILYISQLQLFCYFEILFYYIDYTP